MKIPSAAYDEYLRCLLVGEHSSCARITTELLKECVTVRTLYTDLFRASLYHVGELWQNNKISVATEHLATAITESVMSQVVAPKLFCHDPVGRLMLVSCIANEFHQVGGRMVADIAEMKGWDTDFLGANTPLPSLLDFIKEKRPDVLALSTAVFVHLPGLRSAIEAVRSHHPELPIWLGGQAFLWGGQEVAEQYPNVKLFSSLDQFETELENAVASKPEN